MSVVKHQFPVFALGSSGFECLFIYLLIESITSMDKFMIFELDMSLTEYDFPWNDITEMFQ